MSIIYQGVIVRYKIRAPPLPPPPISLNSHMLYCRIDILFHITMWFCGSSRPGGSYVHLRPGGSWGGCCSGWWNKDDFISGGTLKIWGYTEDYWPVQAILHQYFTFRVFHTVDWNGTSIYTNAINYSTRWTVWPYYACWYCYLLWFTPFIKYVPKVK